MTSILRNSEYNYNKLVKYQPANKSAILIPAFLTAQLPNLAFKRFRGKINIQVRYSFIHPL